MFEDFSKSSNNPKNEDREDINEFLSTNTENEFSSSSSLNFDNNVSSGSSSSSDDDVGESSSSSIILSSEESRIFDDRGHLNRLNPFVHSFFLFCNSCKLGGCGCCMCGCHVLILSLAILSCEGIGIYGIVLSKGVLGDKNVVDGSEYSNRIMMGENFNGSVVEYESLGCEFRSGSVNLFNYSMVKVLTLPFLILLYVVMYMCNCFLVVWKCRTIESGEGRNGRRSRRNLFFQIFSWMLIFVAKLSYMGIWYYFFYKFTVLTMGCDKNHELIRKYLPTYNIFFWVAMVLEIPVVAYVAKHMFDAVFLSRWFEKRMAKLLDGLRIYETYVERLRQGVLTGND